MEQQLDLPFDSLFAVGDNPALWTPRDLWIRATQRLFEHFDEDRRFERKGTKKINFDDLASYYSTFSNTPDGGMIVFGIEDDGSIVGCVNFSSEQLNNIEKMHLTRCPLAQPEFRRVPVIVEEEANFCIAIYVPYIGRLVETNRDEAWIRYGDSKHKMSEPEKQDFRSTRQELSFEMQIGSQYKFPKDFDLHIIQDFCDAYRARESHGEWSNEDVLMDRHLLRTIDGKLQPLNSIVLMAARDPSLTIPGCRVRVQRFASETEGTGSSYSPQRDRTIEGNLVKIIREASQAISDMIYDVTWLNDEGKFVTTPEYPQWAWFEALVNACVHRSYSFSGSEIFVKLFPDRMEIESPGGFVPPVNEKTIYSSRATRNYHLMDALRHLGYVQMAREGTRRIRESMKEWGLPEPTFMQEALYGVVVKVTLRNDHISRKRATDRDVAVHFGVEIWKSLQEHEIKIAAYAFRNGSIQVSEAARLSGRTWQSSKKDLDRLAKRGILSFEPGQFIRDSRATLK
jgi:ATP-dependent DNA helicase RecG